MKDIFVSGRNGYGSGVANPAEVDTRSAGSGLYVYTLKSSGFLSSGKVVVK